MKESSERRSVAKSIRDALRKASGYTDPEWGELKMIGARNCSGSTISNEGDNSPSNRVMSGRRPFDSDPLRRTWPIDSAGKAGFYGRSLSVNATILPSEKVLQAPGTSLNSLNRSPWLICWLFRSRLGR
jgi:hypothetical protein